MSEVPPATPVTPRWTLRQLPLAARLTIATFLISVGVGYCSALVQLHFQHAQPGELMPTPDDSVRIFHGTSGELPKSQLVRLIEASPGLPWNGSGQMSAAFFKKSDGWKAAIKKRPEEVVTRERETERQVMLAWLLAGASLDSYNQDRFPLPAHLINQPITADYADKGDEGSFVKIKTLFADRCVRCHNKESPEEAKAGDFPLETHEQIVKYNKVENGGPGISLVKLAQTTHVHLLGFSMLYGLTGVLLALSSLPGFIRLPLAPLPLLAQVIDIAFWWLARIEGDPGELFARLIPVSGAVVGASLGLHILLSLFSLFGWAGRIVLVVLMGLAGAGGYVAKEKYVGPYMQTEKPAVTAKE